MGLTKLLLAAVHESNLSKSGIRGMIALRPGSLTRSNQCRKN